MTSWKRNGWLFFRIFMRRTSSGGPRGCFRMKFCTDVVVMTGSHYLKSGELWVMPH
ncbi:hypothetical protein Goshw_029561 [Gossypium schwendimanii]|uniref:Uncharacterized protein n=1 Tax=Gossypium schwendimanii TaxID=34291 RepID=A0A7J9NCE3_GOSSC|nr:hypothetical protein [Gossypium schwendimanii]